VEATKSAGHLALRRRARLPASVLDFRVAACADHARKNGGSMKASVGRIVHFVEERDRNHLAAIITAVHESDYVDLTVFPSPKGTTSVGAETRCLIPFEESANQPKSWHWPERE
jgi:hypothetical protein